MTGPEHFTEAERLLDMAGCEYGCPHSGCAHEVQHVARAQAHATLALAAATVSTHVLDMEMFTADRDQWLDAMRPA